MSPDSSSISSSDDRPPGSPPATRRGIVLTVACVLAWLVAADAAIRLAFDMPAAGPRHANAFELFFYYGVSAERKMLDMLEPAYDTERSLLYAGWIRPDETPPPAREPGKINVVGYGMSFAFRVIHQLTEIDPNIVKRTYGGPSSPLNHSYAQFLGHPQENATADFIVLGILASSLAHMPTVAHATWNTIYTSPYTYPRFALDERGQLVRTDPPYDNLDEFTDLIRDPARWRGVRERLAADDAYYDRWSYERDWADGSALLRLVRRAHAQRQLAARTARYYEGGFPRDGEIAPVALAIVRRFIDEVRAAGAEPVVLLFENEGFNRELTELFGPVLTERDVIWLAMRDFVPPVDASLFDHSGHFLRKYDRIAAEHLAELMRARLRRR